MLPELYISAIASQVLRDEKKREFPFCFTSQMMLSTLMERHLFLATEEQTSREAGQQQSVSPTKRREETATTTTIGNGIRSSLQSIEYHQLLQTTTALTTRDTSDAKGMNNLARSFYFPLPLPLPLPFPLSPSQDDYLLFRE